MNIVIIGAGKIGATLTEQLLREGHEITVVDKRTAALAAIGNTLDVMTVEGNGSSMDPHDGNTVCTRQGTFDTILPLDEVASVTIGDTTIPVK